VRALHPRLHPARSRGRPYRHQVRTDRYRSLGRGFCVGNVLAVEVGTDGEAWPVAGSASGACRRFGAGRGACGRLPEEREQHDCDDWQYKLHSAVSQAKVSLTWPDNSKGPGQSNANRLPPTGPIRAYETLRPVASGPLSQCLRLQHGISVRVLCPSDRHHAKRLSPQRNRAARTPVGYGALERRRIGGFLSGAETAQRV
jgi:hypothetical protein